ncbi:MAG TPA: hypothetical protein VH092_18575 [Urbifossiella sp.]|nr:hypothetical protein [Urbifossiella sp.]
MPAHTPPTDPVLRRLYDSARKLAYLKAEMEKTKKAADGLARIVAAMKAHRNHLASVPHPAPLQ